MSRFRSSEGLHTVRLNYLTVLLGAWQLIFFPHLYCRFSAASKGWRYIFNDANRSTMSSGRDRSLLTIWIIRQLIQRRGRETQICENPATEVLSYFLELESYSWLSSICRYLQVCIQNQRVCLYPPSCCARQWSSTLQPTNCRRSRGNPSGWCQPKELARREIFYYKRWGGIQLLQRFWEVLQY